MAEYFLRGEREQVCQDVEYKVLCTSLLGSRVETRLVYCRDWMLHHIITSFLIYTLMMLRLTGLYYIVYAVSFQACVFILVL